MQEPAMGEVSSSSEINQTAHRPLERTSLRQAPWWLIILGIGIVFVLLAMMRNEDYSKTLGYVLGGVGLSVVITVVAYVLMFRLTWLVQDGAHPCEQTG
jgi:hypothetical protein